MTTPRPENLGDVAITVDVGSSGLKLAAYSIDRHRSVGSFATAWEPTSWSAGGDEFDIENWWHVTVQALGRLHAMIERSATSWRLAGITVGAVRIPFVLLDDRGEIVRPCLRNGDRRAVEQVAQLRHRYGDEVIYGLTGHWLAPEFGLPKLLWLRDNEPESLERTTRLLQLHDWFVYRLCGEVCSEPSSAAMSQLLAADATTWADELMTELGLPTAWLPPLRPAGSRAGGLVPHVANATGLPAGSPVHLGGGDTQLSALSAGAVGPDPVPVIVAGTTVPVQLAMRSDGRPSRDHFPVLYSRQLFEHWWTAETNAGGVGATLDQLRRLADDLSGDALHAALAASGLRTVPSADPLIVTLGNPEFSPASWADSPSGQVHGLRADHTAGDVYRAALRCSAEAMAHLLDGGPIGPGSGGDVMLTGGLARNTGWVQSVADATGAVVTVPDEAVTGGIGGASVVTGSPLWAESDRTTARTYRPRREAVDDYFRAAYRKAWHTDRHDPAATIASILEGSACAR